MWMDPVTRSKVNYKGIHVKPIGQKSCDYTDAGGWPKGIEIVMTKVWAGQWEEKGQHSK